MRSIESTWNRAITTCGLLGFRTMIHKEHTNFYLLTIDRNMTGCYPNNVGTISTLKE